MSDETDDIPEEEEVEDTRPISEQIDEIGADIMASVRSALMKLKRKGGKIPKEEDERLSERQRYFRFLQSTYMSMMKMGRINQNDTKNFDRIFLEKIKEKKGTMGEIIQKVGMPKKTEANE